MAKGLGRLHSQTTNGALLLLLLLLLLLPVNCNSTVSHVSKALSITSHFQYYSTVAACEPEY